MSKFIAASRQAIEADQERIRLRAKIRDMEDSSRKTGERMKLEAEVVELKNLAEELRADIVEKDTRLDHLQKQNEELRSSFERAKDEVIKEFKLSKAYTDLLDTNYAAGFEDFRMDVMKRFPEVDFSPIKLNIGAASSLLQKSFEDVNIEDNATTQPAHNDPTFGENPLQ